MLKRRIILKIITPRRIKIPEVFIFKPTRCLGKFFFFLWLTWDFITLVHNEILFLQCDLKNSFHCYGDKKLMFDLFAKIDDSRSPCVNCYERFVRRSRMKIYKDSFQSSKMITNHRGNKLFFSKQKLLIAPMLLFAIRFGKLRPEKLLRHHIYLAKYKIKIGWNE